MKLQNSIYTLNTNTKMSENVRKEIIDLWKSLLNEKKKC